MLVANLLSATAHTLAIDELEDGGLAIRLDTSIGRLVSTISAHIDDLVMNRDPGDRRRVAPNARYVHTPTASTQIIFTRCVVALAVMDMPSNRHTLSFALTAHPIHKFASNAGLLLR